jgi:hypothetical protein
MSEIIEAKKKLFGLLLKLPNPTDKEIDIMYELSMDNDIRKILSDNLKPKEDENNY